MHTAVHSPYTLVPGSLHVAKDRSHAYWPGPVIPLGQARPPSTVPPDYLVSIEYTALYIQDYHRRRLGEALRAISTLG